MVTWDEVRTALNGGAPIVGSEAAARAFDPAEWPGAAAVLTTSGSTGAGKHVVLTREALLASADAAQQVLGPLTWTCALPTSYVAGFMTLVRSFVAGTMPRVIPGHPAATDFAVGTGAHAISLVPTQLHRAMRDPAAVAALRGYRAILLGGAPAGEDLLAEGRAAGLSLIATYGMSETCGGCVWDGIPLPGAAVDVDAEGRIWLAGPQVFSGYAGDPEATASALVDGRVRSSDRGCVVGGRLHVLGRLDSVVVTGGVNVDLDDVRRILAGEPVRATVVGHPDAEWGTRIVLIAEPGRSLDEWRAALSARLQTPALPRWLVEVAKLPLTDRGKLDMAALQELVEDHSWRA